MLQMIVSGVALGAIYGLIALGIVMVFKATGILNFAHGEVLMIGALCSWSVIGLLQPLMPGTPGWVLLLISMVLASTAAAALRLPLSTIST